MSRALGGSICTGGSFLAYAMERTLWMSGHSHESYAWRKLCLERAGLDLERAYCRKASKKFNFGRVEAWKAWRKN
jgi:hypothetical protein